MTSRPNKENEWMKAISFVQDSIHRIIWPQQTARRRKLVEKAFKLIDKIEEETPSSHRKDQRKSNQQQKS